MKKLIITVSIIVLLIIAALAGAAAAYSNTANYSSEVFPDNTSINGVNCSGLSYEDAETKLSDVWNSKEFTVTGQLNEKLITYTDFGYIYDLDKVLKEAKKKHILGAAANHYIHTPLKMNIPMVVSDYSEDFFKEISSAPFLNDEKAVESCNAYVDLSDPDFPIIHEVYGTKVDHERFFDDLTGHIESGQMVMIFDEKNYYEIPKVTADDPSLAEYREYCRKFLSQQITYELGDDTFTIPAEDLDSMLKDDRSGEVDPQGVKKYVAKLAKQYDNVGATRSFKNYSGKQVTVSGGIYGWIIDQEAETKKLIADLKSGKDVSRSPAFSQKGFGTYARHMGDTYIDVDVSNQTVKYYKGGKLVFESICVTGSSLTGTVTDIGVQKILNKIPNATLAGNNVDGSEYETRVNFWLGINWTGEGLHDATWRGNWASDAWTYDGSHGCINMPYNKMAELYNIAVIGTPVVVHY